MPRRKDTGPTGDAAERAALLLDDPWALADLRVQRRDLSDLLPDEAARRAFAALGQTEYLRLFGFLDAAMLKYPAVLGHGRLFRREAEFFRAHQMSTWIDPPALRSAAYSAREGIKEQYRGEVFKANGWPTTKDEDRYLLHGGPTRSATKVSTMPNEKRKRKS